MFSGSHVPIIRRIIVSMRHLVYVTLCRWLPHWYNNSPDDGHMAARKHVQNRNKYTRNIVRQVGHLQGSYQDARSTKHKKKVLTVCSPNSFFMPGFTKFNDMVQSGKTKNVVLSDNLRRFPRNIRIVYSCRKFIHANSSLTYTQQIYICSNITVYFGNSSRQVCENLLA